MEPVLTDVEIGFLLGVLDLAREGRTAELAEMLDAGVPSNLTNSAGDTLLILAAYHDHPDTVRLLLDRGADVDRVNDRGQTALAAATFRRSRENVQALMEAGADPGHGARSALLVAEFFGCHDMTDLLRPPSAAPGTPSERPADAIHAS